MNIDDRIVRMQFDNAQFERATAITMATLDKLKSKLTFKEEAKELTNLEKMGNNVSFDGMSSAVDTVSSKFSALSVIGITALANITNKAVNAGERIAKALTIDPIKTGFQEYETQINATQTILANTQKEGATITDVNKSLDELNKYADLTIYNFTEMTRNIGTFTAAGVKLDTATNAIQGIANLAAVSGSTSQQASTAMYQLSQALSSGTVKLQDWNSVVNAGMGGQVFQDALKETARIHKVNIDQMIKDEGSFRETLKNGWLTSDILTETLQHFTSFSKDYNAQTLKSQGYTKEQIAEIEKLGKTATDAATKVKTFTQLWDVLKEAAQSGWSGSWKVIVGDFEEAKYTLTGISDELTALIGKMGDRRIKFLKEGLQSGYNRFINDNVNNAEAFEKALKKAAKSAGVNVDEMIDKYGSLANSMQEGWLNADILDDATSNLIFKRYKKWQDAVKKYGKTSKEATKLEKKYAKEFDHWFKLYGQDGDQLDKNGLQKFVDQMNEVSGRQHIFNSLEQSFHGVLKTVQAVNKAFRKEFPRMTGAQLYDITEQIDNMTKSFEKFIDSSVEPITQGFTTIFGVIKSMLTGAKQAFSEIDKGLLKQIAQDVVDIIGTFNAGKGTFKSVQQTFYNIFKYVATGVEVALKAVDGALRVMQGMLTASGPLAKAFINLGRGLSEGFVSLLNAVDVSGHMSNIVENLAEGVRTLGTIINGTFTTLGPVLSQILDAIVAGIQKVMGAIHEVIGPNGLAGLFNIVTASAAVTMVSLVKKMFDMILDTITNFGKEGKKSLGDIIKEGTDNLTSGIKQIASSLSGLQDSLQANNLLKIAAAMFLMAKALTMLAGLNMKQLGQSLGILSAGLGILIGGMISISKYMGGFKGFAAVLTRTVSISTTGIIKMAFALVLMAKALVMLSDIPIKQLGASLGALVILLGALAGAELLMSNKMGDKKASGLIGMAAAVYILAEALSKLSGIPLKQLGTGLFGLVIAMGAMIGMAAAMSNIKGSTTGLVAMAAAMLIMASAITILSSIKPEKLVNGLVGLAGAMFILALGANSLQKGGEGGLIALSASLLIFGIALKMLAGLSLAEIGAGLIALAGGMFIMAAGAAVMSKLGIKGSIAMIVLAGAMAVMAVSLKILASIPIKAVGAALKLLAGSIAIFGGAAALLGPTIPAMLGLAGAFLLLAVSVAVVGAGFLLIAMAFTTMASIGFEGMVTAVGGLAAALFIFAGAAMALAPVTPLMLLLGITMIILAGAVYLLGGAFGVVARALTVAAKGMSAIMKVLNQIADNSKKIKKGGKAAVEGAKDFKKGAKAMKKASKDISKAMKNITGSMKDAKRAIKKASKSIAKEFGDKISNSFKKTAEKIGSSMSSGIGAGMKKNANQITKEAKSVAKTAEDSFKVYLSYAKGVPIGTNIDLGIAAGIRNGSGVIKSAARRAASDAYEEAKRELKIKSPSRKFMELGKYSMLGFAVGIDKNSRVAENSIRMAAAGLVDTANNSFNDLDFNADAFGKFNELYSALDDVDTQPTIKPVMDLSDIEHGVTRMNSIFGEQSLPVGATSSISYGMARIQNGRNFDILSAIDRLSTVISEGQSGTTYNINGVTYDDGSALNEAVGTLVRAAKIERRI